MVRIVSCVGHRSKDPVGKDEQSVYIPELQIRNCKPIPNAKEFQVDFHPARAATINGLVLCQKITALS